MKFKIKIFFTIVSFTIAFFSPGSYSLTLSQDIVIKKVLKNSLEYQKIQSYEKTSEKTISDVSAFLDWRFFLQTEFNSQEQNTLNFFENPLQEQQILAGGVEKRFLTGTQVKVRYSFLQFDREFNPEFKKISSSPANTFRHKLGLEIEQDLLRNIFGYQDKLKLDIAVKRSEMEKIKNLENTEDLILKTARLFWKTYISHLSVQLKILKKKDYGDLVRVAGEKKRYGYVKPGELSQIRAEWEQAKRDLILEESEYRNQVKELFDLLNESSPNNVKFMIHKKIPSVPVFNKNPPQTPRKVSLMQKNLLIQEQQLKALRSSAWPGLKLFGSYNIGGYDKSYSESFEGLRAGDTQDYSFGVKLNYSLPSTSIRQKRIFFGEQAVEAAEIEVEITKKEFERLLSSTQENLHTFYKALKIAKKIHRLRKKSYKDMRKAFLQGRLSVFELISAKELSFFSEMEKARLTAQYWQAVIYAQAVRDKLISEYL